MERLQIRKFIKEVAKKGAPIFIAGSLAACGPQDHFKRVIIRDLQVPQDQLGLVNPNITPVPTATRFPGPEGSPTPEGPLVNFPRTSSEAANAFGRDTLSKNPVRWEQLLDAKGIIIGWHLKPAAVKSHINPRGRVMEGYYDTQIGANPQCIVSNGLESDIQGGSIWNTSGVQASRALYSQVKPPTWTDGKVHSCQTIGFTPS